MKRTSFLFFLVLLLTPFLVDAATISGNIYDFSFELVENTIVEINTEPRQIMVATDGRYSFNVPVGSYVISATKGDLVAEDRIEIVQDGEFRFDIILLPDFEQDEWISDAIDEFGDDSGLSDFDLEYSRNRREYFLYLFLGLIAILLNFVFIFRKKIKSRLLKLFKEKKNNETQAHNDNSFSSDADIKAVLDFIKSEQGRTTQKDIRKNIPLSEAKISLLLSELENDGKIKRFKRGRSNVVILRR